LGQVVDEARAEGGGNKGNLVRRSGLLPHSRLLSELHKRRKALLHPLQAIFTGRPLIRALG
jgi:hypothetical protein